MVSNITDHVAYFIFYTGVQLRMSATRKRKGGCPDFRFSFLLAQDVVCLEEHNVG